MALPQHPAAAFEKHSTAPALRSFYDVATGLVPTLGVVMRRKFVLAY